jgi:stress response protein SCP2
MFNFTMESGHVKISPIGKKILRNRKISISVMKAIREKKLSLENGEIVVVNDANGNEIGRLELSGRTERFSY